MATSSTTRTIEDEYYARFAGSAALYSRSRQAIAGGISHDSRHLEPFPPYIERAIGARKWDVDGHELIDYAMGHGALILGHAHPEVTHAATSAAQHGTHFGAGHLDEVRWAEQVQRLIPSAELVRFTSSGTEATMMALRLAAIHTDRPRFIRFVGHFHGWHEGAAGGHTPPLEVPAPGLPDSVRSRVELVPAEAGAVEEALKRDPTIGAIIVEPSGGSYGAAPLPVGFLSALRTLADRYAAVLIFDEVVTGFRWSPGGIQALCGITPDLTTLAKILAGGFPGGAVAGRAEIMHHLEFRTDTSWNTSRKMYHPGTFNANPMVAAAGATCLEIVASGEVQKIASSRAELLRSLLRETVSKLDAPCLVYGESSIVHILPGIKTDGEIADVPVATLKGTGAPGVLRMLRLALLQEGVDFFGRSAFVSATHSEEDIRYTAAAFGRAVARVQAEGRWSVQQI